MLESCKSPPHPPPAGRSCPLSLSHVPSSTGCSHCPRQKRARAGAVHPARDRPRSPHCRGPTVTGLATSGKALPVQALSCCKHGPLALKDGPPGPETGEGQEGLRCVLGAASQACSTKPKGLRFRFVSLRVSFDGRLKAAVCTRASGRAGGAPGVQAWQVQSRNQDSGQPPTAHFGGGILRKMRQIKVCVRCVLCAQSQVLHGDSQRNATNSIAGPFRGAQNRGWSLAPEPAVLCRCFGTSALLIHQIERQTREEWTRGWHGLQTLSYGDLNKGQHVTTLRFYVGMKTMRTKMKTKRFAKDSTRPCFASRGRGAGRTRSRPLCSPGTWRGVQGPVFATGRLTSLRLHILRERVGTGLSGSPTRTASV